MSDDIFDALPGSTPDECGSWAKGKMQDIRDVCPTPEAFKARVDAASQARFESWARSVSSDRIAWDGLPLTLEDYEALRAHVGAAKESGNAK